MHGQCRVDIDYKIKAYFGKIIFTSIQWEDSKTKKLQNLLKNKSNIITSSPIKYGCLETWNNIFQSFT